MRICHLLGGFALLAACGSVERVNDAGVTHTLTIAASGNGTGTITSSPPGIDCGTDCSEAFADGTVVTLSATGGADSILVGWSGGGCSGSGTCTITVSGDVTVQPMFALANSVVVTLSGNGVGSVTSSPAGINCPGECIKAYAPGQVVTLTATAGTESNFMGWSGGGCTGTGPCNVATNMLAEVTATFALKRYAVMVAKSGNGAGTVTSAPAGINCGGTCMASFDSGSMVTLTAAGSTGSNFTGWSGAGCTGTGTCTVTVTAAATVTATFTLTLHTLTVNKNGAGSGTVTSSPAGINCGATCSATYNFGTSVTLTAAPATGSTFTGWSGAGCTGTGTCMVTMNAARTVTATFGRAFACTLVNNAVSCTNGMIPELDRGILTGAACRTSCQNAMPGAGMTTGCWIVAIDTHCYCRSGVLNLGGAQPGGTCN